MPPLASDKHPAFVMASPGVSRSLRQVPESGYPGYDEYVAPSRYWGERLGAPSIFRTYDDVLGGSHETLQHELFDIHKRQISDDEREKRVLGLYRRLIEAHPDLPTDIALTMGHVTTIVFGCVSQFTPDDIRFYIVGRHVRRKQSWQARKSAVEKMLGGWHLEWCPSHATLDVIVSRVLELGSQ